MPNSNSLPSVPATTFRPIGESPSDSGRSLGASPSPAPSFVREPLRTGSRHDTLERATSTGFAPFPVTALPSHGAMRMQRLVARLYAGPYSSLRSEAARQVTAASSHHGKFIIKRAVDKGLPAELIRGLQYGANINRQSGRGNTYLHKAAVTARALPTTEFLVTLLATHDASGNRLDTSLCNRAGHTAMTAAVEVGNIHFVRAMLQATAILREEGVRVVDPFARNTYGHDPIDVAKARGRVEFTTLLENARAAAVPLSSDERDVSRGRSPRPPEDPTGLARRRSSVDSHFSTESGSESDNPDIDPGNDPRNHPANDRFARNDPEVRSIPESLQSRTASPTGREPGATSPVRRSSHPGSPVPSLGSNRHPRVQPSGHLNRQASTSSSSSSTSSTRSFRRPPAAETRSSVQSDHRPAADSAWTLPYPEHPVPVRVAAHLASLQAHPNPAARRADSPEAEPDSDIQALNRHMFDIAFAPQAAPESTDEANTTMSSGHLSTPPSSSPKTDDSPPWEPVQYRYQTGHQPGSDIPGGFLWLGETPEASAVTGPVAPARDRLASIPSLLTSDSQIGFTSSQSWPSSLDEAFPPLEPLAAQSVTHHYHSELSTITEQSEKAQGSRMIWDVSSDEWVSVALRRAQYESLVEANRRPVASTPFQFHPSEAPLTLNA